MLRNQSVDVLKGIGILAIMLGHFKSSYSAFIISWHVQFF